MGLFDFFRKKELPNKNDKAIEVDIDSFFEEFKSVIDVELMQLMNTQTLRGNNTIKISSEKMLHLKEKKEIIDKRNFIISECARTNNIGIKCEENGDIDGAIAAYEENLSLNYPATHSYCRLPKLYRRKKDFENEIRVLDKAISMFMKLNEERANQFIDKHPELYDEVMEALETNTSFRYGKEGKPYNQYDILSLIDRKEKVKNLIQKRDQK